MEYKNFAQRNGEQTVRDTQTLGDEWALRLYAILRRFIFTFRATVLLHVPFLLQYSVQCFLDARRHIPSMLYDILPSTSLPHETYRGSKDAFSPLSRLYSPCQEASAFSYAFDMIENWNGRVAR